MTEREGEELKQIIYGAIDFYFEHNMKLLAKEGEQYFTDMKEFIDVHDDVIRYLAENLK